MKELPLNTKDDEEMDQKDYRLSAVMFTDIVGFSKMMERNEEETLKLLAYHNEMIRRFTDDLGGTVIKTIGDAFLVDFTNVLSAVKCAIRIQNELASFNVDRKDQPLLLRIGVHLGDIHFYENDAFGEGINIASRLQSIARPGRICVSQDVYNLVYNKISVPIEDMGVAKLKNISRQINAFEIIPDEAIKAEEQKKAEAVAATEKAAKEAEPDVSYSSQSTGTASAAASDTSSTGSEGDLKERVRSQVMSEIKHLGRRLSVAEARARVKEDGPEVHEILLELKQKGLLVNETPAPHKKDEDPFDVIKTNVSRIISEALSSVDERVQEAKTKERWNPFKKGKPAKQKDYQAMYKEYVAALERRVEKGKAGFWAHLFSFVGVNVGLGLLFSAVGAPIWISGIVGLSWGIGLVTNWYTERQKEKELKQAKENPPKNREQFKIFRKIWKKISGVGSHIFSSVSTSALLIYLQMLFTPQIPWGMGVTAIMLLSSFGRLPAYYSEKKRLLKEYKDAERIREAPADSSDPRVQQARASRDTILKQLDQLGDNQPFDEDIRPLVDDFVKQIEDLSRREKEMGLIISEIPMSSLEDDLAHLESKRALADSVSLMDEYDKSIAQIQRQKSSFGDLVEQKEKIGLRINNAVNSIKQMQIDLGRVRSFNQHSAGAATINDVKDKAKELNTYLNDLDDIYREIDESMR